MFNFEEKFNFVPKMTICCLLFGRGLADFMDKGFNVSVAAQVTVSDFIKW